MIDGDTALGELSAVPISTLHLFDSSCVNSFTV